MSPTAIKARAAREALVYETARQIRELLDAARDKYGAGDWAEVGIEGAVLELVTEDEE